MPPYTMVGSVNLLPSFMPTYAPGNILRRYLEKRVAFTLGLQIGQVRW
jgi:hypothetical protein